MQDAVGDRMNKFAKYALKKLQEEDTAERDEFVHEAYESAEYHNSMIKQRSGLSDEIRKMSAICYAIKHVVKLKTLNGLSNGYLNSGVDRLRVSDYELPIPKFYFNQEYNCYRPAYNSYQLNKIMGDYHHKQFKKEVVKKWAEVKVALLQPVFKKGDTLMKPILEIDYGDHVYFIHDEENEQIKIGVSKQLNTRFRSIHTTMGREDLQVIKVIDVGGYELEAALHQFFGKHRIWSRKEWFVDHPDIRSFIAQLDAGADPWDLIEADSKTCNEVDDQDEQGVA